VLTLVTVCFNNPKELEKTLSSVSAQSVAPDDYIIVDSSDDDVAPEMKRIATGANARYVWVAPEGVYPAMRHSLTLVDDDSWVWWVNSSDWLAGKDSIKIVKVAIGTAESTGVHWLVGELLRVQATTPSAHRIGSTGSEFVKLLKSGRIGFPHPSTIFRAESLARVEPYQDPFRIASDYAMALRFANMFGPPALIPASLTFHDPTGLTSLHPIRNTWEKSQARIRCGTGADAWKELWRLPTSSVRGILSRVTGEKPVTKDPDRSTHFPLRGNVPFD
jgi:hypothetical protein